MWVTNGQRAGVYLVLTKTDMEAQPAHRGISAFLVEPGMEGFFVGRKLEKLGYKGVETTELASITPACPPTTCSAATRDAASSTS